MHKKMYIKNLLILSVALVKLKEEKNENGGGGSDSDSKNENDDKAKDLPFSERGGTIFKDCQSSEISEIISKRESDVRT